MKVIILIAYILLFGYFFAQGQTHVDWDTVFTIPESKNGTCNTSASGDYVYYDNLNTWIPRGGTLPLQNSPTKVIQLNINIFQRTNGTGNFQNTIQDKQILINYVNNINQIYSSIIPSSDPYAWVVNLPNNDSKIRFDIGSSGNERIFFYKDDALFNEGSNSSNLITAVRNADPNRMNQLNILFTEGYYMAKVDPNITITNGGSGYTSSPTVAFSPSGASACAKISNGKVTSIYLDGKIITNNILITNGGSGYTSSPTITFSPSGATATATVSGGSITKITVTKKGSYDPATLPIISITGGGGSGATAIVTKYSFDGGSYSGAINSVSITLSGGGGNGAKATCFLSGGANGYANYPSYSTLNGNSYVVMLHNFSGYRSPKTIAHEIGHNFNLYHPFENHYCTGDDYLSDIYGSVAPGLCPLKNEGWNILNPALVNGDGITNNLMCYGPTEHSYISPMQVGIIHRSLALTSVRRYVAECYSTIPLLISKKETWDFNIRLYQDIAINSSGDLALNCEVIMPIAGKLIVNNGGKLLLNGNISTNTSQTWQGIIVNNGGIVEITNSSISNYNITVKNGGKLLLSTDSVFNIGTSSSIVVESGGSIQCTKNTIISCSGFIKLGGSITALPGVSLTIQGVNSNTTILQFDQIGQIASGFDSFTLKNGRIQMNNTNAELYINNGVNNVLIDNILVTPYYGVQNSNQGIDIRSTGNITIKNSTFEKGMYGLYAYRSPSSPTLIVENCNFNNCSFGAVVYHGGVTITGSAFNGTGGGTGLHCHLMENASSIRNSNFTNNYYGIGYEGSWSTKLFLEGCTINTSGYGITNIGPFNFHMLCSASTNNTYTGVRAFDNTHLDIDYSNLAGNKYAIEGGGSSESNRYNSFNLNDGYNNLVKGSSTGSLCMYGYFYGQLASTISVNNNNWKAGYSAPIIYTDYKLYKTASTFIILSDNSPEFSFTPCSSMKSASISDISYTEPFLLSENTYRIVKTDLGTMPLDEALRTITNTNEKTGKIYESVTQFKLLSELLLNNLNELNEAENELVKYAYRLFKEQFGKLTAEEKDEKKTIEEALKVIRKLQKDIEKVEQKANRNETSPDMFINIIDEANMLRYLQNYDAAISLLEKNMVNLAKDDACYFEEQICITKAEKQMADNDYNGDFESLTKNCACVTGRKSGDIENIASKNPSNDDYSLTVMPNPISNASEIKVCGYEGAELVIYNSSGQSIINEIVASDNFTKTVSKNELGEGVYMVVVIQNGNSVLSEKIVVVK